MWAICTMNYAAKMNKLLIAKMNFRIIMLSERSQVQDYTLYDSIYIPREGKSIAD